MKAILGFFRKRWVVSLLGIVALALLIWFVGPLIAIAGREPLVSPLVRWLVIGFVALIWIIVSLLRQLRASKSNKGIVDGIVTAEAPAGPSQSDEEVAVLRDRFEEATTVLKKSGDGSKSLYTLPWYVIIGPPGSGKTTALINSGLEFPLAERFGREALRGVGGTRDCDWWFTDSAVLLDTAGRYTTQDSHAEVDSAAWEGFLDLIRKHRKRRPINGVFIAISLSDLLLLDENERLTHINAIKKRIHELYEHFGIRFPIYVLLTKSDLIAGFMEFFDDLGQEERKQVWGYTLPLLDSTDKPGDITEQFGSQFDALLERLNERLVTRLAQERDLNRRALIYGFPRQLASLKELINDFLLGVFRPSRYEEAPLLRGVYFTSGTQEGTPIDRVMGALARTFNVDQQAMPTYGGQGRSYFINHPLTRIAFVESELAGANVKLERRRSWLQWGAYAAAAGIVGLALVGWAVSYFSTKGHIAEIDAQATEVSEGLGALSAQHVDALFTLPVLNAARNIPGAYAGGEHDTPMLAGLGLYPGRLNDATSDAYLRLLANTFLPRLQLRIEEQMRAGADSPDYQFEALKAYLMLDDEEHFVPEDVAAWIRLDWATTLPREVTAEQRQQLTSHLSALLDNMPATLPVALDASLIERTRRAVMRMPLSERVYSRLKRLPEARAIEDFTVANAGGRDAAAVLRRKSNRPLTEGVSGFFSYQGFHEVFLPQSGQIADRIADESWILGEAGAIEQASMLSRVQGDTSEREQLDLEVAELYLTEYARQYEDLLADITLVAIQSRADAVTALRILSDDVRSPLLRVLQGVRLQTDLQRTEEDQKDGEDGQEDGAVVEKMKQLGRLVGAGSREPTLIRKFSARQRRIEHWTKTNFGDLNELTQPDQSGMSPFQSVLALLEELYVFLDSVNSDPNPEQALMARSQELNSLVGEIKREAVRQPPVVNGLLSEITSTVAATTRGDVRAHINRMWRSDGFSFCGDAIAARYPVERRNPVGDIRLDDFGAFFGPGGVMDRFFQTNLMNHVDTGRRPWRWRAGSGMSAASTSALRQFERARLIRDTFFRGGNIPSVRFDMRPISMDASINRFVLSLAGQAVEYSHGPQMFKSMVWPGDGPKAVRVEMMPPTGGGPLTESGDWAWFKLLDRSSMTPANKPEHFNIVFTLGGRSATWELRAASAFNPFRIDALEQFRCPDRL